MQRKHICSKFRQQLLKTILANKGDDHMLIAKGQVQVVLFFHFAFPYRSEVVFVFYIIFTVNIFNC